RTQLSVPASRLIKRSASASPIRSGKPQTTSTYKRSPIATRSTSKPASPIPNMSLSDFISSADRLIKLESRMSITRRLSNPTGSGQSPLGGTEQQCDLCSKALDQGAGRRLSPSTGGHGGAG
ncbi:hypothetical protein AWZ03_014995, partial [Drosophila navojoa]